MIPLNCVHVTLLQNVVIISIQSQNCAHIQLLLKTSHALNNPHIQIVCHGLVVTSFHAHQGNFPQLTCPVQASLQFVIVFLLLTSAQGWHSNFHKDGCLHLKHQRGWGLPCWVLPGKYGMPRELLVALLPILPLPLAHTFSEHQVVLYQLFFLVHWIVGSEEKSTSSLFPNQHRIFDIYYHQTKAHYLKLLHVGFQISK